MLLLRGPAMDTCSTWHGLIRKWKQTQSLISTYTMTVLDYVETMSGDELNSASGMWSSIPHAKGQTFWQEAGHGCWINANLLEDLHHKYYSQSTRVPKCKNWRYFLRGAYRIKSYQIKITFS
jgi:hypothetical protein